MMSKVGVGVDEFLERDFLRVFQWLHTVRINFLDDSLICRGW